jgi:antitoxin VapB
MEPAMAINVNNTEADALTREFATMAGVSITDAIVIAMKEAIERRTSSESPAETAARLRKKHGISLTPSSRKPLSHEVFDSLWGEG